jgi:hypothetical protein
MRAPRSPISSSYPLVPCLALTSHPVRASIMIIAVLGHCGTLLSPFDAGRLCSQFTNLMFWSMVLLPIISAVHKPAYGRYWSALLERMGATSPSNAQSYLCDNHHVLIPRSSVLCSINYGGTFCLVERNSWSNSREIAKCRKKKIMCKVDYPNEQMVKEGAGSIVFLTLTISRHMLWRAAIGLFIHFRPQTSIWVGEGQKLHLTVLQHTLHTRHHS